MAIQEKTIDELAHLCRLEFSDSQKKEILADLNRILKFCEKLNEVDTEGIEPLIYLTDHDHQLREDAVTQSLTHESAIQNAPLADTDYFRVPKFIRKG